MLSTTEIDALLSEVRTYCGITWTDERTDDQLRVFIRSSAVRLESVYGSEIRFTGEDMEADETLAHDLLIARCFYLREKALDDFEKNYRSELLTLRSKGKIRNCIGR